MARARSDVTVRWIDHPLGQFSRFEVVAIETWKRNLGKSISMAIQLSSEIKALLDRPNFAHLATLMEDGSPQSVPCG
jgi:hypothetical protein